LTDIDKCIGFVKFVGIFGEPLPQGHAERTSRELIIGGGIEGLVALALVAT
jgi:hypothetical protein